MKYYTISSHLLQWYRINARNLPWRNTKNPYQIWLSEIILQQTRVNQGINYYHTFIEHYPTVWDLAKADEQSILKDWQGLGYYSRARNLHATANIICDKYNGIFPNDYKEIINLKGIGEYTAAAIASFAFNQPFAVLDGNVYRFLSRLYNIETQIDTSEGKKLFKKIASDILNPEHPGLHNQAMMEMGALICTPQPHCQKCPVREYCLSYKYATISERPVKTKKTSVTNRYFTYFFFYDEDGLLIKKRTDDDIWKNLYDFPIIETSAPISAEEAIFTFKHPLPEIKECYLTKHLLSHQRLHIQFLYFSKIPSNLPLDNHWITIREKEISNYPFPKVIEKYLNRFHIQGE